MREIDAKMVEAIKDVRQNLAELVAIPSISSDPSYEPAIYECAEKLRGKLSDLGAAAQLIDTTGYPLVIGRIETNPAAPTVGIYNHYDVQPIASPDEWASDPFSLAEVDGKWVGRGASDNKGNLVVALKSVELALQMNLPLNFQFIYEGEEEDGSRSFDKGLRSAKYLLDPDLVIIADSGWISRDQPSVKYGLRGLLYMHWNIRTAAKNCHSGAVGGTARNPIVELAEAATRCIDAKSGKILIPGIYDDVRPVEKAEIECWLSSGLEADAFISKYGLEAPRHTEMAQVLQAVWCRPTFEVHGLAGGYSKRDGRMTVIPKDAQLLVSMRLVSDQEPDRVFSLVKEYLRNVNPHIDVTRALSAKPYLGKFDSPVVTNACNALEKTFGKPVLRIRSGGSIGAVSSIHDTLGEPEIILMGFGLPEHGSHGPNEFFDQEMAEGGLKAYTEYFQLIARV